MNDLSCPQCGERQARIAELEIQVAELERLRHETSFLRSEVKAERDLRALTG
jgi:hypothetical protein